MRTINEIMEAVNKYQETKGIHILYAGAVMEVINLLHPDEEVFCAFTGSVAQSKNNPALSYVCVVLTNQRLLMLGQLKGSFEMTNTAQSFDIGKINAVSASENSLIIDLLEDEICIVEPSVDIVSAIVADLDAALQDVKAGNKN